VPGSGVHCFTALAHPGADAIRGVRHDGVKHSRSALTDAQVSHVGAHELRGGQAVLLKIARDTAAELAHADDTEVQLDAKGNGCAEARG
jgi:hypothetical protein